MPIRTTSKKINSRAVIQKGGVSTLICPHDIEDPKEDHIFNIINSFIKGDELSTDDTGVDLSQLYKFTGYTFKELMTRIESENPGRKADLERILKQLFGDDFETENTAEEILKVFRSAPVSASATAVADAVADVIESPVDKAQTELNLTTSNYFKTLIIDNFTNKILELINDINADKTDSSSDLSKHVEEQRKRADFLGKNKFIAERNMTVAREGTKVKAAGGRRLDSTTETVREAKANLDAAIAKANIVVDSAVGSAVPTAEPTSQQKLLVILQKANHFIETGMDIQTLLSSVDESTNNLLVVGRFIDDYNHLKKKYSRQLGGSKKSKKSSKKSSKKPSKKMSKTMKGGSKKSKKSSKKVSKKAPKKASKNKKNM